MNELLLIFCSTTSDTESLMFSSGFVFFPPCSCGPVIYGSSAVCLHTLRHGVAEGLLEAVGEHSRAMDRERAHWTGAGSQWVRWL